MAEAKSIAELMTRADLTGADGHGVFRLPQYIRRIKGGAVNVKPKIRIEREAKLFSVGAISIALRVPFDVAYIAELVNYHDLKFTTGQSILADGGRILL